MKEFKEIIDGIAHSLNMTVDSLVKAYPHLRTEYFWYYMCSRVQLIFGIVLFVYLLISTIFVISCHVRVAEDDYTEEGVNVLFTVYKILISGGAVIIGVILLASCVKGFASPDILIIKDVLSSISQGE